MRSALILLTSLVMGLSGCAEDAPLPGPGEPPVADNDGPPPDTTAPLTFQAPDLSQEELQDGWISLFDGQTLFGWFVPEGTNWHVEDGCIVADTGNISLLRTPFRFDDFEFRCEFHMAPGGNSGIFLRTKDDSSNPAQDTYELNICDDHPAEFNTGSLVTRYTAEDVPEVGGDWHQIRVRCDGNRIQAWLDDELVTDFEDTSDNIRRTGQIGLQMNSGRIAFRGVFLRPIHNTELFNQEDLSGWRVVPGSKSEFTVREGAIHVSNGPGFLETESTWDDFMLHVRTRTNGEGLNSGVFFRAMPGTEEAPSHGYEMQIHNGYKDDDRTQPVDSGSGAIFRRVAARYVVANDKEWFTQTLIAQGDRFGTWVNGYQVVNWQDNRDPDVNPRRGLRLEAGHISLQGHDPTTDLEFSTIRIHPFQK